VIWLDILCRVKSGNAVRRRRIREIGIGRAAIRAQTEGVIAASLAQHRHRAAGQGHRA